jgi:hypothetical protein
MPHKSICIPSSVGATSNSCFSRRAGIWSLSLEAACPVLSLSESAFVYRRFPNPVGYYTVEAFQNADLEMVHQLNRFVLLHRFT